MWWRSSFEQGIQASLVARRFKEKTRIYTFENLCRVSQTTYKPIVFKPSYQMDIPAHSLLSPLSLLSLLFLSLSQFGQYGFSCQCSKDRLCSAQRRNLMTTPDRNTYRETWRGSPDTTLQTVDGGTLNLARVEELLDVCVPTRHDGLM